MIDRTSLPIRYFEQKVPFGFFFFLHHNICQALRVCLYHQVFICASAVGYYGFDTGAETLDETSALGKGFLAEVSRVWEEETAAAKKKVRMEIYSSTFCLYVCL